MSEMVEAVRLRRLVVTDLGEGGVVRILRRPLDLAAPEMEAVTEIVAAVAKEGDAAVLRYTALFDGVELTPERLRVAPEEFKAARAEVPPAFVAAVRQARERIAAYHERQKHGSWVMAPGDGSQLGQQVTPLSRVGVYVPGGTAPLASSVLMNAVPARVAGVESVALATPPDREGRVNPYILVAAEEAGVNEVYRVGGAQAVAALAFGTRTIPRVDKITGPGNIYVTLAKKLVYGQVGIDLLAGPSEVAVVADATANPRLVAADLLSQAEHDLRSVAVLFTPELGLVERVEAELATQLAELPRAGTAARALAAQGAVVVTPDLETAVRLADAFAPEHLELLVAEPGRWLPEVKHAGTVFLGAYAPEPVGDYLAGTNHILPTGGTARFASGLSVDDFMRKTSFVSLTPEALARLAPAIETLAEVEGLTAHARAVRIRLEGGK
ncbi:MAG: histidinol dehydrogenase [Bacillota bacterium]|nr:histidinol dehydrogenase [Bacillota bacterium]